jgi:hypothetical protein
MWLGQMENFKWIILDCLAQPAHAIERQQFDADGHPERAQYVIHCPLESLCVCGFLVDDTAIHTCRAGGGPIGPDKGPGRPRCNHTYDIQWVFYRHEIHVIADIFNLLEYLISFISILQCVLKRSWFKIPKCSVSKME